MTSKPLMPVQHVSVAIDRPPAEVYAFAANAANLPRWARGLANAPVEVEEAARSFASKNRSSRPPAIGFSAVMSNAQLSGKVAIVTGASSGIGRATALLFAREGARVVVTARRRAELDAVVAEIAAFGGEAVAMAGDVRDEAHAKALVSRAIERFGGLDVAFNNAAMVGDDVPLTETSLATWREMIDTNLTSAFLGAKYQVPALRARGGGSLIFTSSFVGHTVGMPGMGVYAATKAGQLGLMRTLAAELGPERIRVNAILPGGTLTPSAPASDDARAFVRGIHALKRMAEPEEIARAVLFLASDASSFVTGSAMLVDGGVSITRA